MAEEDRITCTFRCPDGKYHDIEQEFKKGDLIIAPICPCFNLAVLNHLTSEQPAAAAREFHTMDRVS